MVGWRKPQPEEIEQCWVGRHRFQLLQGRHAIPSQDEKTARPSANGPFRGRDLLRAGGLIELIVEVVFERVRQRFGRHRLKRCGCAQRGENGSSVNLHGYSFSFFPHVIFHSSSRVTVTTPAMTNEK